MVDLWVQRLGRVLLAGKGFTSREMKHTFPLIARDFKSIPVTRVPKVKVGVVGEIYVKYSRWATTTCRSSSRARTARSTSRV